MDEKVILVDTEDNVIGETMRSKAHAESLLHRIVAIYLTRPNGDILVQERMSGKFDHSAAGHMNPGETQLIAAKRELCEELGVCGDGVSLAEIGNAISGGTEREKYYHMCKVYEYVGEPKEINPQEVKSVHWENPLDIYQKMQTDTEWKLYTGGFRSTLEVFLKYKKLI